MYTVEVLPQVTEVTVTDDITEVILSTQVYELELSHAVPQVSLANLDDDLAFADLSSDGVRVNFVAGEALSFGDVCYMASDGKWAKADASAYGTSRAMAMAVESMTLDSVGRFLLTGFARNDSWTWTVGEELYLSENSGEMTHTPPTTSSYTVIRCSNQCNKSVL